MYCYDLKAATDRMPVDLQVAVLKHLLGDRLANTWRALLVERNFAINGNGDVRYAVGQPMGLLSS
jgi:hypothetical protein